MKTFIRGYSFDDVTIQTEYSEVLPHEVDLHGRFSIHVPLKVPFVSAPMDRVTEHEMAIKMALLGGLGIIHRYLPIQEQVAKVHEVVQFRVEKDKWLNANVDTDCVLLVGGAVGATGDYLERASELARAGARVLVIDTGHGNSLGVKKALAALKKCLIIDVVPGNISTEDGARRLVGEGADGLRVNQGTGSICTTGIITGHGSPSITAALSVSQGAGDIPFCLDGGIRNSGDIVKAIAAGASSVMMGSLFAATYESPGEIIKVEIKGKPVNCKEYRGMGSSEVLKAGGDRYGQKAVPEGVPAIIPIQGSVEDVFQLLAGGLRQGMGLHGCKTIDDLRLGDTTFIETTQAALQERHVHSVIMPKDESNYSAEERS